MRGFVICPVRDADELFKQKIRDAVALEIQRLAPGASVHIPFDHTDQIDSEGGVNICRQNFNAMLRAEYILIWHDPASQGSRFDRLGMLFAIRHCSANGDYLLKSVYYVSDSVPYDDGNMRYLERLLMMRKVEISYDMNDPEFLPKLGMLFAIKELEKGWLIPPDKQKQIVIANQNDVIAAVKAEKIKGIQKSFARVLLAIAE